MRVDVVPWLVGAALRTKAAQRFLFNTVSQTKIRYPTSLLSEGGAGSVRAGDRLPWVAYDDGHDNFEPLRSIDWQMHVYGAPTGDLRRACDALHVPVHAFRWDAGAERAGLARDAAYLVRPDGYVGLATSDADAGRRVGRYFKAHGLRSFS